MTYVLFDKAALDAFGRHLRLLIVAGNVQAVHFRPQTDELTRRSPVSLVLELPDDLCVGHRV